MITITLSLLLKGLQYLSEGFIKSFWCFMIWEYSILFQFREDYSVCFASIAWLILDNLYALFPLTVSLMTAEMPLDCRRVAGSIEAHSQRGISSLTSLRNKSRNKVELLFVGSACIFTRVYWVRPLLVLTKVRRRYWDVVFMRLQTLLNID